jgi:hypothetical protein
MFVRLWFRNIFLSDEFAKTFLLQTVKCQGTGNSTISEIVIKHHFKTELSIAFERGRWFHWFVGNTNFREILTNDLFLKCVIHDHGHFCHLKINGFFLERIRFEDYVSRILTSFPSTETFYLLSVRNSYYVCGLALVPITTKVSKFFKKKICNAFVSSFFAICILYVH